MITKLKKIWDSYEFGKVKTFVSKNGLLNFEDKVLVALSGGADSVSLLLMLIGLREEYSLTVEAFHLNHNIRQNAVNDEKFCEELCKELDIKLHVFHSDIPLLAKQDKISEETAGRNERYRIMEDMSKYFNHIATAHHADDNAETVLMHLIRGSGVKGLCGIPVIRGKIVRPLLCIEKDEIYHFLDSVGFGYVVDESNFENEYFRNRVRNVIIPEIKKESCSFSDNVLNLSQIAGDYCDLAHQLASKVTIKKEHNTYTVMYDDVSNLHRVVMYSLLCELCNLCGVYEDISNNGFNDLIALIQNNNKTTWNYDIHSVRVQRIYDKLCFANVKYIEKKELLPYEYKIGSFGTYVFPKQGFVLKIELTQKMKKNGPNEIITYIDCDKIKDSVIIRSRMSGDAYNQIGLGNKKTVKKLFIDRKVPEVERNRIPILCIDGKIAAIIGYETDEGFKVTDKTKNIIKIEYINLEK